MWVWRFKCDLISLKLQKLHLLWNPMRRQAALCVPFSARNRGHCSAHLPVATSWRVTAHWSLSAALTLMLTLPLRQRKVTLNLRMGTTGNSAEPQLFSRSNTYSSVLYSRTLPARQQCCLQPFTWTVIHLVTVQMQMWNLYTECMYAMCRYFSSFGLQQPTELVWTEPWSPGWFVTVWNRRATDCPALWAPAGFATGSGTAARAVPVPWPDTACSCTTEETATFQLEEMDLKKTTKTIPTLCYFCTLKSEALLRYFKLNPQWPLYVEASICILKKMSVSSLLNN